MIMINKTDKTDKTNTIECSEETFKKKWNAPQFSELSVAKNTKGTGSRSHPFLENVFYTVPS